MVDRLKDKVALITGGSRGQGAAEAELFAAEGARVIIADVLDDDGAQTAARTGDVASYHHLDVTDEEAWHALVAEIVEQHGKLDVLVNNAGIYRNAPIVEMTEEMYRQVIDINQIGVWLGMKAVGPPMIAQESGSVVNISSTAGFRGGGGSIAYTASKFAVRGMTKVAAREWGRYNIRVNSIHPGPIDTMMLHQVPGFERDSEQFLRNTPLRRAADPSEVAYLALYLASDESSFSRDRSSSLTGAAWPRRAIALARSTTASALERSSRPRTHRAAAGACDRQ